MEFCVHMFTHLLVNDPCFRYNFPRYLLDMEMSNKKEYNTFGTKMIIPCETYLESCYSRTRVKIFGGFSLAARKFCSVYRNNRIPLQKRVKLFYI